MKRSSKIRVLVNVVALIFCGVLAGVVVAAAAFPALGVTGLTAKAASDSFQSLPGELKTPPLPQRSTLYAADGSFITSFYDENREISKLQDVPEVMQHAMVAAEDARFYQHKGVDMQGVIRAFVANQQAGEITQGASTLTQQYIKNILKYSAKTKAERDAAEAPTPGRKLREMRYAIALEKKYTKKDILEKYLNIVFFGNGGYGLASAAKVYFNKPTSKLTLADSAMLAGMVKSPTQFNPLAGPKSKARAQERRNYILQRMVELHFIKQADADAAKKLPLGLNPKKTPQSCVAGNTAYGFYCDWFLTWWKNQPEFGKTAREREDNLRKGGYRIYTALDPKTQAAAQTAVDGQLDRDSDLTAGSVIVEPGTGRVKAMAINRTFGHGKNSGLNRPFTENPLLTGSGNSPGFQAGSTFKMFTMVAALLQGMPLATSINSPNQVQTHERIDGPPSCGGFYCPSNASPRMAGVHTMWSGFGESVNTYFVQLEERVGVKAAVEAAEKLGVVFRAPSRNKCCTNEGEAFKAEGNLSFTLGTALVTPLDMATAYATVAARGKHCDPMPLTKLLDRDGKPIPAAATPKCSQVIPPDVADAAANAARCPPGGGPPECFRAKGNGMTAGRVSEDFDRQVAGKSGTTNNDNTAWFVGFTPNLASAVYVANPDSPTQTVHAYHGVPVAVFIQSMTAALAGMPKLDFVDPTSMRKYGVQVRVPNVNGDDPFSARSALLDAGFTVQVSTEKENSKYGANLVARTVPEGGDFTSKGAVITIYLSNGQGPNVHPTTGTGKTRPPLPPLPPGRHGRPKPPPPNPR